MTQNSDQTRPANSVDASPTKKFFMSMLTRDIALSDAIMDLLDNCIDGVHRLKKDDRNPTENKYDGFFGDIIINEDSFTLRDNCGGIPFDIAKDYAFKMGRDENDHSDDNLQTVGMYGIGMKRAIFKMGMQAKIYSYHPDKQFVVEIPPDWSTQGGWYFNYIDLPNGEINPVLDTEGTLIEVRNLHENISNQFSDNAGFIKNLRIEIRNHYGYIIQQGFRITLNGVPIDALELNILTGEGIQPYAYRSTIDGVEVEAMVGFYRAPASSDEIDLELDGGYAKSSSENAGITVICNDRVVLYCDKTHLTGWGELPVPKYHTQFISIAGVVHFKSNNPIKLPVTTTKRGLDTSSVVYAEVKNKIKDGLKIFTSWTNHWKTPSEERSKLFEKTIKINALKPGQTKSPNIILSSKRGDSGEFQIPNHPKPNQEIRDRYITVTYQREREKVDAINSYFLSNSATSASEVGGWCFDEIYSQIEID